MTRGDKAKELFQNGYNCSQAVAIAYSDLLKMDESQIAKMTAGFGGGIGRMRETCGAVSGMTFVWSTLFASENPNNFEAKKQLYAEIQALCKAYINENGSIICRELLGLSQKGESNPTPEQRTQQYYKKRPCAELVKCAGDIIENAIKTK